MMQDGGERLIVSGNVKRQILITGAAGFIGYYLAKRLLESGAAVTGLDNMNGYYDVRLKEERLRLLCEYREFRFEEADISDAPALKKIFEAVEPDIVVNLAAQAGVRYSITNPDAYISSNIVGFYNILEACRHSMDNGKKGVSHLVYASSSSVYGSNRKVPYRTQDQTERPVSLYAATKKSNELLAYAYSKLYRIPTTGLRFFTVYGPLGRPDMAYFSFTNKMVKGEEIPLFNYGDMFRDFTYVDDIVTGVVNVLKRQPAPDEDGVCYKLYNIGNSKPESLLFFVETLEKCLMEAGVIREPARKRFLPMQPGDVYQTYADVTDLERDFGFKPQTPLEEGLMKFARWYADFYG